MIHTGGGDDKEFIAIDNNPTSPYFGRVYAVFTDFSAGGFIYSTHSDDTSTWTTPVALNGVASVQGAWPAIAPNGDLYVAWVRWDPYPSGPITIEMVKSINGGATFSSVASPMAGKVNPRDATATSNCGRPALHGNIRIIPWPQVAIGPDGVIHVVYSYDPDGYGTGDVIDVFYRRSLDGGASWQPEFRLNDDNTTNDQWFPTLSVGPTNRVVASWYDRWEDPANTVFRYYSRSSTNGGATWQPSVPVSDVQSPIYLDPNLATCYHGDYDHQVQDELGRVYLQWSDDRNFQGGHDDPDVWFERDPAVEPLFVDGFESGDFSAWSSWQP